MLNLGTLIGIAQHEGLDPMVCRIKTSESKTESNLKKTYTITDDYNTVPFVIKIIIIAFIVNDSDYNEKTEDHHSYIGYIEIHRGPEIVKSYNLLQYLSENHFI